MSSVTKTPYSSAAPETLKLFSEKTIRFPCPSNHACPAVNSFFMVSDKDTVFASPNVVWNESLR